MKFEEVLSALREGKKIRKAGVIEDYMILDKIKGVLMYKDGSEINVFFVSSVVWGDWEIVPESEA